MAVILVPSVLGAGLIAAYLLHIYADRKHCPWYVLLLVWTTWSLGLIFFLLLPFDMSTAFYKRCVHGEHPSEDDAASADPPVTTGHQACVEPPWGLASNLVPFWSAVYWTSMLLGYFMSDFLRDVIASGAFTISGRIRNSLRNGALFYVPFCIIGLVFILYQLAIGSVTLHGVRAYCKAAANAFSLCIVVLMLGYGLVEVPRTLWNKGDVEGQLRLLLFRVSEYKEGLRAASEKLGEALAALDRATARVTASECVGDPLELRRIVGIVASHIEDSERTAVQEYVTAAARRLRASQPAGAAPLSGLVHLSDIEAINFRVKESLTSYRRMHANFERAMDRAIAQSALSELSRQLDEASWNVQRAQRAQGMAVTGDGLLPRGTGMPVRVRLLLDRTYFRVTIEPYLWKGLAACCGLLSVLIIVCESTIIFRDVVNLSIISWILLLDPSGGWTCLLAFAVPLLYNSLCVYFAFFKMKLFNFYALHTGQNSDYGSLLFNGTYMCRLAPALAYNYLNLLHEPHRAEESGISTAYLLGLGDMNVVPFLGADYYNDFAPIIIVLLCGCTYLNLFSQVSAMCGSKQFQFEDDYDTELTGDGARLVEEEKRRREGARRARDAEEGAEVPPPRTAEAPGLERSDDEDPGGRLLKSREARAGGLNALSGVVATVSAWGQHEHHLPAATTTTRELAPVPPEGSIAPQITLRPAAPGSRPNNLDPRPAVSAAAEMPELRLTSPTAQELAELNALQGLNKFQDL